MKTTLFTVIVVVKAFVAIVAGTLFGTDATRKVNIVPGITIVASAVFGYCIYLDLLDGFWFVLISITEMAASIATIIIVECQRSILKQNKESETTL